LTVSLKTLFNGVENDDVLPSIFILIPFLITLLISFLKYEPIKLNKNLKKVGYIAKNIYKFKQKLRNKKKIKKYLYEKKKELIEQFNIRLEYLEVLNESDLNIYNHKKKFRIFIAYYLNKIRLIDNF